MEIREEEADRIEREKYQAKKKPDDPRLKTNFFYKKGLRALTSLPDENDNVNLGTPGPSIKTQQTPLQSLNIKFDTKLPEKIKSIDIKQVKVGTSHQ